tara:strand:+ start:1827 stop:2867 length:1041 start_codon:yes stop_codon:yes gene_type:complete
VNDIIKLDRKTDTTVDMKKKIDITILVTTITQREITIQTANYYSEICNEVIVVDEEQPHLSATEINDLKKRGITYIPYRDGSDKSLSSTYEKRLIAANHSSNRFLVHSNHDERYTYHGLLSCIAELENDTKITFCAGQSIAIRRDNLEIFYSRSYKNLAGYQNMDNVDQRLYHHAEIYSPIAHFAVWRRELYISVTERTIAIHNLMPSTTMMEEVVFEFAADMAGNSKAIPELYWIRNRINGYSNNSTLKGKHVFKIIEEKLNILFEDLDNIQMDIIINSFWKHFNFVRPSFVTKSIITFKQIVRTFVKKKKINSIVTLLKNDEIIYDEEDLSNVLESMKFFFKKA